MAHHPGQRIDGARKKKAREHRATHYAHGGERAEAVGVLRFPRGDRPARGTTRYCAALAFAQGHARGLHACCVDLPDGRAWLVAAHQGKVLTQTDRVYATPADAHVALQALMDRHGAALTLHGQVPASPAEPFDLTQLGAQLSPANSLRSVGRVIPTPMIVALAACMLTVGGRAGWDLIRSWRSAAQPGPSALSGVSPEVAWREAFARLASQTRVHTDEGVSAVLAAIVALPMDLGGWQLRGAQCQPHTAVGWQCGAHYQRQRRSATNATFLAARPQGWTESWHPLDGVTASFALADGAEPLAIDRLQPLSTHDANTFSQLQSVLPAFASIAIGEPTALRIEPPVDGFGVPMPALPGMPSVHERSLSLDGPLRSLALVPASLSGQVAWRLLDARLHETAEPALNRSRWMASLQGTLYALR
ncbi:hypothetical protein [Pigmentiphaga litoralis]|uniref:hypothetical protein n=1 Tax=Pigmentiphaga litoralis TaxID=516702 RepID=UPI003B42C204